jgi:hypothetical protein
MANPLHARCGRKTGREYRTSRHGSQHERAQSHEDREAYLTPPERVDVEGEMEGIANTSVWRFESAPNGSRVTVIIEAPLPWRLKVMGPLVKRQFQAVVRDWMQDLAKYVEAD